MPLRKYVEGHDHNALTKLVRLYSQMQESSDSNEGPTLIVTGDLTSYGLAAQYRHGHEFLRAGSTFGSDKRAPRGLYIPNWNEMAVTGNHDHFWSGSSHASTYFKPFPYTYEMTFHNDKNYSIRIQFIGVDTDADIPSPSPQQMLGRGGFTSQLDQIDNDLPSYDPADREIRVLLLHHSYGERNGSRWPYLLKIQKSSKGRLREFVTRHKIPVILSGHLHIPDVSLHLGDKGWAFMEARCGTTAESGRVPLKTSALEEEIYNSLRKPHSCMVHKVIKKQNGNTGRHEELWWSVQTFVSTTSGFRAITEDERSRCSNEIKVWPLPS